MDKSTYTHKRTKTKHHLNLIPLVTLSSYVLNKLASDLRDMWRAGNAWLGLSKLMVMLVQCTHGKHPSLYLAHTTHSFHLTLPLPSS